MFRADFLQEFVEHRISLIQTHLPHLGAFNLAFSYTGSSDTLCNLPPSSTAVGTEYNALLAVRKVLATMIKDVEDGERIQVTEVGNVYVVPDAGA